MALERVKHLLDAIHSLFGRKLCLHESVAHAWALLDTVRNSIQDGELRWQVEEVVRHLDDEEWLAEVGDLKFVHLLEVLGDRHL